MGWRLCFSGSYTAMTRQDWLVMAISRKSILVVPNVRRYVQPHLPQVSDGKIVDVACGYCNFINFIETPMHKYAVDLNEDAKSYAHKDVTVFVDSVLNMDQHFEPESVNVFFMSNFLEHIDKQTISDLFALEHSLLVKGGLMMIFTPNIRNIGGEYWDYFDHITPLTERSLEEVALLHGFRMKTCVKKFIPYTMKNTWMPLKPWLVRLYLKLMPLSGMLFGQQSFIVLEKI